MVVQDACVINKIIDAVIHRILYIFHSPGLLREDRLASSNLIIVPTRR